MFLRKEPDWSQTESEEGAGEGGEGSYESTDGVAENPDGIIEGSAENAVQQTFPEVITSLDEIHEVGTLAQARRVFVCSWRRVFFGDFLRLFGVGDPQHQPTMPSHAGMCGDKKTLEYFPLPGKEYSRVATKVF